MVDLSTDPRPPSFVLGPRNPQTLSFQASQLQQEIHGVGDGDVELATSHAISLSNHGQSIE